MYNWQKCILFLKITAIASIVFGSSNKIAVPLFLFSGQSNMVGLGTKTSDLSSEEKEEIDNIKIYLETEGRNLGEWAAFGPGFGGMNGGGFGVELFFGRVLADSMPDTKLAFIKDAKSGTPLGQSSGWLPPSSGGPGTLYKNMMDHIDEALEKFNDAFDTSEYFPRWAGFIWHQGESDATNSSSANSYEENLTNLIKDLRTMAEDDSMPAIIPMINQGTGGMSWNYIDAVHAAEIATAEKLHNCDTTYLKDYNLSDGVHYDNPSMKKLGTNSALRWLAMEYTKHWWDDTITSPIVYQSSTISVANSTRNSSFFDLSGRRVKTQGSFSADRSCHTFPPMILIQSGTAESGKRSDSKSMNFLMR
jgi:hypothetical protein